MVRADSPPKKLMNQSQTLNEQFLSTLISPKSLTFNQIHTYICKAAESQFQRIKNSICFTVYIYFPPTERSFRFKIEMSGKISSKFELATLYNVLIGKVSSYNTYKSTYILCLVCYWDITGKVLGKKLKIFWKP